MAASTEQGPVTPTVNNSTVSDVESVKETVPTETVIMDSTTETVKEIPLPNPVMQICPPKPAETEGVKEEAVIDNGHISPSMESVESPQLPSFKEESNFVSDLKENEIKALQELKLRVEEALRNNEFNESEETKETQTKEEAKTEETKEEAKTEETKEEAKTEEDKTKEVKEEAKTEEDKTKEVKEEAKTEEIKSVEKEEEIKATVDEVKIVETVVKSDGADVKKEETPITVTETVSIPAHDDIPKHEETHVVPQTVEDAVTVTVDDVSKEEDSVKEELPTEAQKESPAKVTVSEQTEEIIIQPVQNLYLWGVPLLHTMGDERTDVLLLKFLRARDFKVNDAFTMLKNTMLWRKSFGADGLLQEDLGNDWADVVYMHGQDKEGHPVCYNVYGAFENKELYDKTFGDAEKCDRFLRWRIQLLEKEINDCLSFRPGGISSMVQITDFKNTPAPVTKKSLRQVTKRAVNIFQDNYPEFVARKIFVNVPWWYAAVSTMISPFLTQRTKSKFVYARPARVPDTLFRYISPEYVPIQYGGLSRNNDTVFSAADGGVSEILIKPAVKQLVEIPATEIGSTIIWDLSVLGWDVIYGEEFVPEEQNAYTIIIQKHKKMSADEEPMRNSYKVQQRGKVILTIDNTSSKKKRLLYRTKIINH